MKPIITSLIILAMSSFTFAGSISKQIATHFNEVMESKFPYAHSYLTSSDEAKYESISFFAPGDTQNKRLVNKLGYALEEICYISIGSSSTQLMYQEPNGDTVAYAFNFGTADINDLMINLHYHTEVAKFKKTLKCLQGKNLTYILGNSFGYSFKKEADLFISLNEKLNVEVFGQIKDVRASDQAEVVQKIMQQFLGEIVLPNVDGKVLIKNRAVKPKFDNYWVHTKVRDLATKGIQLDYLVDLGGGSATLFKITYDAAGNVISSEMLKDKFKGSANKLLECKSAKELQASMEEFFTGFDAWMTKNLPDATFMIYQTGKIRGLMTAKDGPIILEK